MNKTWQEEKKHYERNKKLPGRAKRLRDNLSKHTKLDQVADANRGRV